MNVTVRFSLKCLLCKYKWTQDLTSPQDQAPPCPKCDSIVVIAEGVEGPIEKG